MAWSSSVSTLTFRPRNLVSRSNGTTQCCLSLRLLALLHKKASGHGDRVMNGLCTTISTAVILTSVALSALGDEIISVTNFPPQQTSALEEIRRLQKKAREFYSRADYPSALEAMKRALSAAEAARGDNNTNVAEVLDL